MTTNQKIDILADTINALSKKMDERFDRVEERLDKHDQKFIDLGDMYLGLSNKLDIVIRQTSDLPIIRDDIVYLKIRAARNENNISKINEQLIRMEAKDDYLLEQINTISNREYA